MNHTIISGSIVRDGNSILLVQEKKERVRGQWNIPTGRLEPGESLQDCATREVAEEAGIDVSPKRLIGVYSKPGETTDVLLAAIFYCETAEHELDPDTSEVLDAEWVPTNNVTDRDLRSSHIQVAINDHQNKTGYPPKLSRYIGE